MRYLFGVALVAVSMLNPTPGIARQVKIPAGTIVVIQTLRAISSETARTDDIVELQVAGRCICWRCQSDRSWSSSVWSD
jgi:hypothetical protein